MESGATACLEDVCSSSYALQFLLDLPDVTPDARDGSGDFKSRLDAGGNCEFAGLILGRGGFRFGALI
jgi:hypothetical protein